MKYPPVTPEPQEMRILRSGRSPGESWGSQLRYSCLQNPTDRGAWRATVREAAESHTTEVT